MRWSTQIVASPLSLVACAGLFFGSCGELNASAESDALAAALSAPDEEVVAVLGCGGASLLERAKDPTQRGAWAVGQRTVTIGRLNKVEVLYPAKPGSEVGQTALQYDLRSFLPESEQSKVPDEEATLVSANTFRGLPLDDAHGPYPAVVFVHGTGAYRVGSLSTLAMWASHGFIVLAADHPGVYLADQLAANGCGQLSARADVSGDINAELDALRTSAGSLAFLAGRVDLQRLGLAGHSSGAVEVARASSRAGVQVVVSLAGTSAVSTSSALRSALFIGGLTDEVMPYAAGGLGVGSILYPGSVTSAFQGTSSFSPLTKRLIGISEAGHLNLTDMCQLNLQGGSAIDAALEHGVCGTDSVAQLANCGTIERQSATDIINVATVLTLEETLQCRDRSALIAALPSEYTDIADYQHLP